MNANRKKRQGAVLVEGIIAASSIVILFGATLFFHDMFRGKGNTMRDARHQAWSATRPCGAFSDVAGEQSATVVLPNTLRTVEVPASMTFSSRTSMECNVEAVPGDTLVDSMTSILDLW